MSAPAENSLTPHQALLFDSYSDLRTYAEKRRDERKSWWESASYQRRGVFEFFTATGVRFHGNHKFSKSGNICLERDRKNPVDENAIKVLLIKEDKTKSHVAYVRKNDTKIFEDIPDEVLSLVEIKVVYISSGSVDMQAKMSKVGHSGDGSSSDNEPLWNIGDA